MINKEQPKIYNHWIKQENINIQLEKEEIIIIIYFILYVRNKKITE